MFKNIKDKILSFIYPKKCVFCSDIIPNDEMLCDDCKKTINVDARTEMIGNVGEKIIPCTSMFKYTGDIKEAFLRFKFSGYKYYSEFFSEIISEELLKNNINEDINIVTCVPLSRNRKSERGYNQSELIAKLVAKNINVAYEDTLIKIRDNLEQHSLPYKERIENVKNVYRIKNPENIYKKDILLCDDIVTTGNTLKECCEVLIKNGANSVICCTIARA